MNSKRETAVVRPEVIDSRADAIRAYLKERKRLERRLAFAFTESAKRKIREQLKQLDAERHALYEVR